MVTAPSLLDGVRPGAIPENVKTECDAAQQAVTTAIGRAPGRRDGSFTDAAYSHKRVGCRMIADGIKATAGTSPDQLIIANLRKQHWIEDLRYQADGPDGGTVGMRHLGVACVISVSWDAAPDDDEPDATAPRAPAPDSTQQQEDDIVIDCGDDPVNLADMALPAWAQPLIAGKPFADTYALAPRIQFPPFVEIDFDADANTDVAVFIEERTTGKQGFAIFSHNTAIPVVIFGAGHDIDGCPDDFFDVTGVDAFHHGSINLGRDIAQPAEMAGDALYTETASQNGLLYWNGTTPACAFSPHESN